MNRNVVSLVVVMISAFAWGQVPVPTGSVLSVRLDSSLNSKKLKVAQTIRATIMQDVPNSKVHRGAKVFGQVVAVRSATNDHPAELSLRFDSICSSKRISTVNTNLRALASMMDVSDADTPATGPDRGTPWAWATRNLIGGEVAYGQGSEVARGTERVGEDATTGVLVRVDPNPVGGCRGELGDSSHLQALWVFSSDACGVYGFPNLTIAHAGRNAPLYEITLGSKENINVRSGSGMLLRVTSVGALQ